MTIARAYLVAGLVALALVAGPTPSEAYAEASVLDDAPPVMHGIKLLDGRHALTPQFGFTLNDEYTQNLMAGLSYRYYFAEWVGIGVDIWAGGGVDTSLTDDINRELSRNRAFTLSTSSLQLLANASVELVPFVGKAMIFGDEMVRVDLHLNLGIGVALTNGTDRVDDETSLAPMFGIGVRFYPLPWLAVGVDLRDYLVNRVLASRKDGSVPGASFDHNWLLGLSVGFILPTEPEIDE